MTTCNFTRCKLRTVCNGTDIKCAALYQFEPHFTILQLEDRLKNLKKLEPTSDNPFFRLNIIGYEISKALGSLEHAIVYAERFKNDIKSREAHLKNAQLELGDCFTQLQLLCETYNFDLTETRLLGINHLEERHKDFKEKGWTEI